MLNCLIPLQFYLHPAIFDIIANSNVTMVNIRNITFEEKEVLMIAIVLSSFFSIRHSKSIIICFRKTAKHPSFIVWLIKYVLPAFLTIFPFQADFFEWNSTTYKLQLLH